MSTWSLETLSKQVDDELDALPVDMRARFVYVSGLIEEFGPQKVGMPHVRSLGKKLWEIRFSGRDGIARAIYMIALKKKSLWRMFSSRRPSERPNMHLRLP